MRISLIFSAMLLVLAATAQTRHIEIQTAGQDSTGRDSVYIVETIRQPTATGWQESRTARLVVGKSEARAFLQDLQGEIVKRKAEIEAARDQQEADRLRLVQLRQQLNTPSQQATPKRE